METALNTLTAFYANNEPCYSERFIEVCAFVKNNGKLVKNKLKTKQGILLWAFYRMPCLHKMYANLSSAYKKR